MLFLVENCFHWIGFHIVNYLLEKGYEVDGVDNSYTDKKEHLSMYMGRNASFQNLSSPDKDTTYDRTMKIADDELTITLEQDNHLTVKLPLLFGEWMPMNRDGMYHRDAFISFDSELFLNEAVYIDDFLKSLFQWLKSSQSPSILEVKSINDKLNNDVKLENSIYIRNNVPIEENLKTVIKHYKKHEIFY